MYPFNKFLSIQCIIVHCRYNIVQQISRAYSFSLTKTLCLLISNSEFPSPLSPCQPSFYFLYDFDYPRHLTSVEFYSICLFVTGLFHWTSLVAQMVKRLPTMWETWVRSLGWEDPLEKEMATHSSILAWKIPWTEDPHRLHSMGSQTVGQDWATSLIPSRFIHVKAYIKIFFLLRLKHTHTHTHTHTEYCAHPYNYCGKQ